VHSRVERLVEVRPPGETEAGEHGQGLLMNCLHAGHDPVRFGGGVLQGQFQVVQDGQPSRRDRRSFLGPLAGGLPGHPLAEVVEIGQRPPPTVLQVGHLAAQRLHLIVTPGASVLCRVGSVRLPCCSVIVGHPVVNSASITSSS
jgi:hypothetical protein